METCSQPFADGVLEVRRLPRTSFVAAHALQRELLEARLAGKCGDVLVLTEHEPVVTIGRGTDRAGRRDLHRYLRDLEEVVLRVLAEVDVRGTRRPGLTGVWIGERKVCSIGVAVRRWVTWHGLALNLSVDLEHFRQFRPCGLDASVMANVAEFVELPPTRLLYEVLVVKHVCEVFGLELPPIPPPTPPVPDMPLGDLPILQ
jgi:lipoate-protein ligase B